MGSVTLKARLARLEHKTADEPGQLPAMNIFDGSMDDAEIDAVLECFI